MGYKMEFTYSAYKKLLKLLQDSGYKNALYDTWNNYEKTVILRHDVDLSIKMAVPFSEIEKEMGMEAVYFLLLNTDFYNIASHSSRKLIDKICRNGGKIGLHFDEAAYGRQDIIKGILKEKAAMESVLDMPITYVSMHRPSKETLEADYRIKGIINSYSRIFFHEFKYISDSRRMWHENVEEIARSGKESRLHILTHTFWYRELEEEASEALKEFISSYKGQVYLSLYNNIRDLDEFLKLEEVKDL